MYTLFWICTAIWLVFRELVPVPVDAALLKTMSHDTLSCQKPLHG